MPSAIQSVPCWLLPCTTSGDDFTIFLVFFNFSLQCMHAQGRPHENLSPLSWPICVAVGWLLAGAHALHVSVCSPRPARARHGTAGRCRGSAPAAAPPWPCARHGFRSNVHGRHGENCGAGAGIDGDKLDRLPARTWSLTHTRHGSRRVFDLCPPCKCCSNQVTRWIRKKTT
jgi:hypothetical protein